MHTEIKMGMRYIFMLLLCLLSLHCCLCSAVLQYYISPHPTINKTCALSNSYTVAPCYTLHELCDNQQLLLNKTSVELLLLSLGDM